MMMPGHKIKKAVFDLRFNSKTAMLQENSSLGGFIKQDLMPVVDQVLTEHALQDHVICIDKLEIDLGRIRLNEYKSQMPSRLREELDRVLKSKIPNLHQHTGTQDGIVPLSKRNFELIERFLLTGSLSADLKLKDGWTLDRRLRMTLKQAPSDFLRFLKINSRRPQVLQRLVRQFPAESIQEVVRLLAPAHSQKALAVVNNIVRQSQKAPLSGMQAAAFAELIWGVLLEYLLRNSDSRFTTGRFINWISASLEQRRDSIPDEFAAILAEQDSRRARRAASAADPERSLRTIAPAKESQKILDGYNLYQTLQFYLQYGIMPWSNDTDSATVSLTKIIAKLKAKHPEKLLKLRNELRHDPTLGRKLAEKLAPPVIMDLITALLAVNSPGTDQDQLIFIQAIDDFADRAADRQGYYAHILEDLVNRRPIDLVQIAARTREPEQAAPVSAGFDPGRDPDLIRACLTEILKSVTQADRHDPAFSTMLGSLEVEYPFEYREYLAWLSADPKRFEAFLRIVGSKELKQTLSRLAGFPSADRTIELLEKVFSTEGPSQASNRTAILHALTQLISATRFSNADVFLQSAVARLVGRSKVSGSLSCALDNLENLLVQAEAVADETYSRRLKVLLAAYQRQGYFEPASREALGNTPWRDMPIQETAAEQQKKNTLADKPATDEASALINYLTGDQTSPLVSNTAAKAIFTRLIRHSQKILYAPLRDHLKDRGVGQNIITLLSEDWLTRVLAGLWPDRHRPVQTYADMIADACYSEEILERPSAINRLKWEFIFAYLAQSGNGVFRESDFIRRFKDFLAGHIRKMDPAAFTAVLSRNLAADIQPPAHPARATVLRAWGHFVDESEYLKLKHPAGPWNTEEDLLDEAVVQNAGMVIAAPYLPQLWKMLDLIEDRQFKDLPAAERAAHLLQFMTDKSTEAPEYQLVLNKILCGVKSSEPITNRIDISDKEREAIDGLIRGMIENWKTIGQTSVEGFRKSFFQRRGWLRRQDDGWQLKVEQRAFDMLLDSIPWGFATIKHPWMDRVVYVKWR